MADSAGAGNAYDAVVILEGINDVRAGLGSGSAKSGLRTIIVGARDRAIVPVVTRYATPTSLLSSSSLNDLNLQIWELTAEALGLEIYRQSLDGIANGGAYPTQAGYDQIAELILQKVTREFPLQPCDARSDKAGHGCPLKQ